MLNNLNEVKVTDKNKILGEGAYSEVLKVQYQKDQKLYALKQIDISHLSREDCNNLKNEMKLHQSLNHPNIIKFHDALQIKHMVYFLLEYACNGCLFFYIHPKKGLPERLALRFLYQTALAVQYIHQNQCLHRDIKPENILLDEDFNVKLCDFGWSCILDNKQPRKSICGTYEYMPPEVLRKNAQTEKVDIWCIGIMFYEMLHGKTPFDAEGIDEIKEQLEQKQIMVKESISTNSKDLLRNLLRKKESERFDIEQVLNHKAFHEVKKTLHQQISPEDFAILMDYYLVNVRSQKRHLPESIEKSIKKKEENTINTNLIKEIKESFFQTANNVEGFFDQLPHVNNSVQATQDFFEISNRNIPAQTFAQTQKNSIQDRKVEQIQSVQDNLNFNKDQVSMNRIQSFNYMNTNIQQNTHQNPPINFSKLYQNIQKQSFTKKTNTSNQKNFNNQNSYKSSENKQSIQQQQSLNSNSIKQNNYEKQDSQGSQQQNNSQPNKNFQSSRFQKPNPMTFQNYTHRNYSRDNKTHSENKNLQLQTDHKQSQFKLQHLNQKYSNNPPLIPQRKETQQIKLQNIPKDKSLDNQNFDSQRNINIHNQSFSSQYKPSINTNDVSFQQQPRLTQEHSPQVRKKVQKISIPNNQIQSQNSPDLRNRLNQGHSKSFFSSSAHFQPVSRSFQIPLTEKKQQFPNIQNQERKDSFYAQKNISTIQEEDDQVDKNYRNMNFVNASYRSIATPNIPQETQTNTLEKNIFQKNSIPNDNLKVQKEETNNIRMAPPTHKYIMKNGTLQKIELTEQDFKEHGPRLAKNYSGYIHQKQMRSFSTDVLKTKMMANAKQIPNFNLDLKFDKTSQNNLQQQKSLTNRESFNQNVTLFQDQIFRRNITIIKKQAIE